MGEQGKEKIEPQIYSVVFGIVAGKGRSIHELDISAISSGGRLSWSILDRTWYGFH